ncbi:alpha/beta fold hydrolase [Phaeobacter sp. C3_T13_0]|uniref:alpha/beta fold hydrolase n=1 Tax=Phaeobacter cretensis TaxID=3342641 RepID=UPI0039BCA102
MVDSLNTRPDTVIDQQSRQPNEAELVHMLYDAVIDNSLWPEMISELMEHIELSHPNDLSKSPDRFHGLITHFERAMRLSENIVALQEENATLGGVLDSLSVGLMVFDHGGNKIFSNRAARDYGVDYNSIGELEHEVEHLHVSSETQLPILGHADSRGTSIALVDASKIKSGILPPNAAKIVVGLPALTTQSFEDFRLRYFLSKAEGRLVKALHASNNLRKAATECRITYESARTYLKRVYLKTGVSEQSSLLLLVDRNPLSLLDREPQNTDPSLPVRRNLLLRDGRNLEYFEIGPPDGHILLHFDALTGVAIDAIGAPERYIPHLEALGLRIIVPCRPGTFGSHFKTMAGLSDFTNDLNQLLDHLDAKTVTVFSQAFGSCSALAFAATTSHRVDKLVLCAPSYPRHEPMDWRSMDVFYIISGVIGRRAPALLKAIVPYLMRSVMQNTKKYLERHITRSKCPADIAVLSSPVLQKRIPEMLALRTLQGSDGLVQENYLNTHGWDFELGSLTMPVHILQGELDNVSDPEGSRKLQAALPNAMYHSFPSLGQYLLFTEWPWILEACKCDGSTAAVIERARESMSDSKQITAA